MSEGFKGDVGTIVARVRDVFPDMVVQQLSVTHPTDDDGIWYFHRPEAPDDDIQIESSYGLCPFLIEDSRSSLARRGETVSDVVRMICEHFGTKR